MRLPIEYLQSEHGPYTPARPSRAGMSSSPPKAHVVVPALIQMSNYMLGWECGGRPLSLVSGARHGATEREGLDCGCFVMLRVDGPIGSSFNSLIQAVPLALLSNLVDGCRMIWTRSSLVCGKTTKSCSTGVQGIVPLNCPKTTSKRAGSSASRIRNRIPWSVVNPSVRMDACKRRGPVSGKPSGMQPRKSRFRPES